METGRWIEVWSLCGGGAPQGLSSEVLHCGPELAKHPQGKALSLKTGVYSALFGENQRPSAKEQFRVVSFFSLPFSRERELKSYK